MPLERATHDAIGQDLHLEGDAAGALDRPGPVRLDEGEHAEEATHPDLPLQAVDGLAHDADRRPGGRRACEQPDGARGRRRGTILVPHPVVALLLAQVLTQQCARHGLQDAHVERVPLDSEPSSDVARREMVVRPGHFDRPIEMDGAMAELVVAERLRR